MMCLHVNRIAQLPVILTVKGSRVHGKSGYLSETVQHRDVVTTDQITSRK